MRTLLVGDSHVRRFENYMKGSLRNETFNISDLGIFDFCGISGGSIANHAHTRAIISAVRNTRPQHVIVNLGGNDLDSSEDIECIISRLVSFASLLRWLYTPLFDDAVRKKVNLETCISGTG